MKCLTRLSFKLFYSEKHILNEKYLKIDSPTILVSNHPNTLTDPLNAAKHVDAVVHFLANASLFKNKTLGKLLNTFYCIPVERPADVDGRRINNAASFEKCYDFLRRGGTLYIAPEGGSKMIRSIRKLKTGTARIALNAEAENNFDLGIKILPVGINYSDPKRFRSSLIINAGKPLYAKDYKEAFEKDAIQTARTLTKDLEERMEGLVLHTDEKDRDVDKLLTKLQKIKRSDHNWNFKEEYSWAKIQLDKLLTAKNSNKDLYENLEKLTNSYCSSLEKNQFLDADIIKKRKGFSNMLFSLFGFIPALFGFLNNFILYLVPKSMINKEGFYKGYAATVYLLFGLIFLPIIYCVYFFIVKSLSTSLVLSILYLLLAFIFGIFAAIYFRKIHSFKRQRKASKFKREQADEFQKMIKLRKEALSLLANL